MTSFQNIEPAELKKRLEAGENMQLIDVREAPEWEIAKIEGADLKPLTDFMDWKDELDPAGGPFVLYCHHGLRSAQACNALAKEGVAGLLNLSGGIDQWAREIDSSLATY